MIVGTSHIAAHSAAKVEKAISQFKPAVVALELDRTRYAALFSRRKRARLAALRRAGLRGWLLGSLGAFVERRLGKRVEVRPGIEMATAVRLARQRGLRIELIDREITLTLRKLVRAMSVSEKLRLIGDLGRALFVKQQELEAAGLDLRRVPSKAQLSSLLRIVRKRYPGLYRVLIAERDEHMAARLATLIEARPRQRIVAVVGAGHAAQLMALLKQKLYKSSQKQ